MSVMVIGDQRVGKTSIIMELAREAGTSARVISPSFQDLRRDFMRGDIIVPTGDRGGVIITRILIEVSLPTGKKQFPIDWLDTEGEIWKLNSLWHEDRRSEWERILETLKVAQGLVIIFAPYRDILQEHLLIPRGFQLTDDRFRTTSQWKNRMKEWGSFIKDKCGSINHVIFCLNMADLFCDTQYESGVLLRKNWFERHNYVLEKYFDGVRETIEVCNQSRRMPVQLMITSIYNRSMLELPWIYLGSYLANRGG